MIKIKTWNARNSRSIAKFHYAEIGHFKLKSISHDLFRSSLKINEAMYRLVIRTCCHVINFNTFNFRHKINRYQDMIDFSRDVDIVGFGMF